MYHLLRCTAVEQLWKYFGEDGSETPFSKIHCLNVKVMKSMQLNGLLWLVVRLLFFSFFLDIDSVLIFFSFLNPILLQS